MADQNVWRSMVDAAKVEIVSGSSDAESVARRIRELRRGAPDGYGNLAIHEAIYELGVESRATA